MVDVTKIFEDEIKEAADSLVKSLPITEIQLRNLSDNEVDELHELITKVKNATSMNDRTNEVVKHAKLIGQIISKL